MVRGSHTPTAVLQDNSAVLVFTGVDTPVEANGIDNGLASSATDESKHSVGVQGDSFETLASVFPKSQDAGLVSHKDQLSQVALVPSRHLDH